MRLQVPSTRVVKKPGLTYELYSYCSSQICRLLALRRQGRLLSKIPWTASVYWRRAGCRRLVYAITRDDGGGRPFLGSAAGYAFRKDKFSKEMRSLLMSSRLSSHSFGLGRG